MAIDEPMETATLKEVRRLRERFDKVVKIWGQSFLSLEEQLNVYSLTLDELSAAVEEVQTVILDLGGTGASTPTVHVSQTALEVMGKRKRKDKGKR